MVELFVTVHRVAVKRLVAERHWVSEDKAPRFVVRGDGALDRWTGQRPAIDVVGA